MKSSFTIHRTINATPQRVFDKLTDHRAYAQMTPLRSSELEKEGEPAPNGIGAVRKLGLAGPPIREEVVGYESPTHFAYKALSGLPVSEHLGDVRLRDVGGQTEMTYTVSFTAKIPRTEPIVGAVLRQAVGQIVKGVAKAVE